MGSFILGRATAPGIASRAESAACDDAQAVLQEQLSIADENQSVVEARQGNSPEEEGKAEQALRTGAIAVTQNPDCFSASERATAQTYLDNWDKNAADAAAKCASAQTSLDRSVYCG